MYNIKLLYKGACFGLIFTLQFGLHKLINTEKITKIATVG